LPVFFASFRFDHPPDRYGRFEIVAEADNLHRAEQQFRKKIAVCFSKQPPAQRPVSVYLLDIVEISDFSQAVLMNLSSVREDQTEDDESEDENRSEEQEQGIYQLWPDPKPEVTTGSVFFSGLPVGEPNAQHWSISMPQDPECFMLID
jgi:hypothetical protein